VKPDIAVSTDIIVGFPGETEEQFEDTLSIVDEVGYDSAFTFIYSPRTGTPAAGYPDQIPAAVAHERFDRLTAAVNRSSLARNDAYVGRRVRVLVDGVSKRNEGCLSGRTDSFKLVNFTSCRDIEPGEFVDVLITGSKTFSLDGKLCTD
jgi:tRNA-2-methylthio-N6-dimethylallyladenosine synthase